MARKLARDDSAVDAIPITDQTITAERLAFRFRFAVA